MVLGKNKVKLFLLQKMLWLIEEKKKKKSLSRYPYRYEDREGRLWFNPDYRVSFYKLRKLM